jgi:subtilisin family serine protease
MKAELEATPQFDPALKQLLLLRSGSPLGEEMSQEDARAEVPVLARLQRPDAVVPWLRVVSRFGVIVSGRVPLGHLIDVHDHPNVASLKASRNHSPERDAALVAPSSERFAPDAGRPPDPYGARGSGTVIAILGWGLDFAHVNFRNSADGSTRLIAIWDQRGGGQPLSPAPFGYGRELTREQINKALRTPDPYGALQYDPVDVDRNGSGAHDTHVADIAAGNGSAPGSQPGMASDASLIFVHLRGDDTSREETLGDSVRLLEAIRYVVDQVPSQPLVCNLSLDRCAGPHDWSPLVVQGLDALLGERPGFAVVKSTGNYFVSDMHSSGRVGQGQHVDVRWHAITSNDETAEMEVWYSGSDSFEVELIDPGGHSILRVPLGEDGVVRAGGQVVVSVFHRRHDPNNMDNQIQIFLRPEAPLGIWTTRLHGKAVGDGRFHAWIERDSPFFQSRFTPDCSSPFSTFGTIVGGRRTIAVGAYDGRDPSNPIGPFSSAGPTRDGRLKPDVSAPGVGIWAAKSSRPDQVPRDLTGLTLKSGTSMAAPWTAGVVARMFEVALPELLMAEEVRDILMRTARRDPPREGLDHLRYGAGRVDAIAALNAVRARRAAQIQSTRAPSVTQVPTAPTAAVQVAPPFSAPSQPSNQRRSTDRFRVAPLASDVNMEQKASGHGQNGVESRTRRPQSLAESLSLAAGWRAFRDTPLLRKHKGTQPDLIVRWNDMVDPTRLDVVLHLHGYSLPGEGQSMNLLSKLRISGLDFQDPDGLDPAPGRSSPTMCVLPRGSYVGDYATNPETYIFPALESPGGVAALIRYSQAQLSTATGLDIDTPIARRIVTAHSGGGIALMKVLAAGNDPDEIHVFDGLYGDAAPLIAWLRRHIEAEVLAWAPGKARCEGGLCIAYIDSHHSTRGTGIQSLRVRDSICEMIRRAPTDAQSTIRAAYNVLTTTVDHIDIPRKYGWRLLADIRNRLPQSTPRSC